MFTGIIEATGIITRIVENQTNKLFTIASAIADELKIDQSVSHNGVCLTVDHLEAGTHRVTAIHETLEKTNLNNWHVGDTINLERCLAVNGRFDGHVVQGHVDGTAVCRSVTDADGSYIFTFAFPSRFTELIVEKGSVCVNGISLTAFAVSDDEFSVAIIPYTLQHTNISSVKPGHHVNIEFDIFGKYAQRMLKTAFHPDTKHH
jgi:riboflavin synthase